MALVRTPFTTSSMLININRSRLAQLTVIHSSPASGCVSPVDDPAESLVVRVVVGPDDVPADHAGLAAAAAALARPRSCCAQTSPRCRLGFGLRGERRTVPQGVHGKPVVVSDPAFADLTVEHVFAPPSEADRELPVPR